MPLKIPAENLLIFKTSHLIAITIEKYLKKFMKHDCAYNTISNIPIEYGWIAIINAQQ